MTEYNGGFKSYADRVTPKTFFRADDRFSKAATIKSGQVIKQYSFLQSDVTGKLIAHTGLAESAIVRFTTALTASTGTIILGGLTFTAGSAGATAAQLATAWSSINDTTTAAAANAAILAAGIPTTVGIFTGTLSGWDTASYSADAVTFTSTTGVTNVADLANTGNGTVVINKVEGVTSFPAIAGVAMYDVNASTGDVNAEVYTEASFWASALCWLVAPAEDVMTLADGTTIAYTAYNTGTIANSAADTKLLQQKFVEGSEFTELGFLTAGDLA
jgi:hypothetical protein